MNVLAEKTEENGLITVKHVCWEKGENTYGVVHSNYP